MARARVQADYEALAEAPPKRAFIACTRRRCLGATVTLLLLGALVAVVVYEVDAETPNPCAPSTVPPSPYDIYPSPEDGFPSSPLFAVAVTLTSVSNGSVVLANASAHVYYNTIAHRNTAAGATPEVASQDQSVSFAGFAFDASQYRATVVVTAAFGATACILRPLSYGIPCTILSSSPSSTVVSFTLAASPRTVSVELLSAAVYNTPAFLQTALFVFADPPEPAAMVPSPSCPTAVFFARGVHTLSGQMSLGCSITNVYLAPGAYVHGGFIAACHTSSVVISGRGIISGETFPWHSPLFKYGMVNMDVGKNNVLNGLTLIDPPMFYTSSFAFEPTITNVKMAVAWPYNSDGIDTGTNGVMEDVFIRANDDSVKIQGGGGGRVSRVVVWQMINGGVIQMGWVSPLNSLNVMVTDIDVIHVDFCNRADGHCSQSNNEAIVDLAPSGTSVFNMGAITIANVRVECDAVRVLYIQVPPAPPAPCRACSCKTLPPPPNGSLRAAITWAVLRAG